MKKYKGPTKHIRKDIGKEHTWYTFQDGDYIPIGLESHFEELPIDKKEAVKEPEPEPVKKELDEEEVRKTLPKMSKDGLNDFAAKNGIEKEVNSKMRKKTIIEKILEVLFK